MKPYGATAVIIEENVTPETIGQAVYELIKKMEVLDGIWWESLRVFIRRPQAPGTPFDSVLPGKGRRVRAMPDAGRDLRPADGGNDGGADGTAGADRD